MIYLVRAVVAIFLSTGFLTTSHSLNNKQCNLEIGDLVFFSQPNTLNKDDFVSAVSTSSKKSNAYHVAIIVGKNNNSYDVIHATQTKGVILEDLEKILNSEKTTNNAIVFYRRVNTSKETKQKAKEFAYNALGGEYNDLFFENNLNSKRKYSYYCSQLIEQAYNQSANATLFKKQKLNFSDQSGNLIKYWKNYYAEKGYDIPFNQCGTHPSTMLQEKNLSEIPNCDVLNR